MQQYQRVHLLSVRAIQIQVSSQRGREKDLSSDAVDTGRRKNSWVSPCLWMHVWLVILQFQGLFRTFQVWWGHAASSVGGIKHQCCPEGSLGWPHVFPLFCYNSPTWIKPGLDIWPHLIKIKISCLLFFLLQRPLLLWGFLWRWDCVVIVLLVFGSFKLCAAAHSSVFAKMLSTMSSCLSTEAHQHSRASCHSMTST